MNEERVWLLFSLQLSGEATPEEQKELNDLLKQYPDMGLRMEIMRNVWKSKQQSLPVNTNNYDKHLQRLSNHLAEPVLQFETETDDTMQEVIDINKRRRWVKWLWLPAGVAASLLLFFLVFSPAERKTENKSVSAKNTISTRSGSKSKIELPDGTQVWLNADSKLTYDQNFLGNAREVNLTGEAYFDVAHITSQTGQRVPFIIHTNSIDIKVLGTAFNVRCYPGEKTTETALIRGSVEITLHSSPDKKIILKPDEKLIVRNDNTTIIDKAIQKDSSIDNEPVMTLSRIRPYKNDTSNHIETMWVKNKLAFENESFERMLPEIERWYNVTFVVKNESLKSLHFRGVFENKSLSDVMEALSIARGFHYEIRGDEVIIW